MGKSSVEIQGCGSRAGFLHGSPLVEGSGLFSAGSFILSHTLTRVAHWLERGEPGAQKAAPLPWIISALEVLWPMRV